jgi:HEPN domain-containing protein
MNEKPLPKKWLERARSNLERARAGKTSRHILYEDLCFDCQQAVEKSLKALLIFLHIEFEWTHNIGVLLQLLKNNSLDVPEDIEKAASLSVYAVRSRYPGEAKPVSKKDYFEALGLADIVFKWVKKQTLLL